MWSNKNDVIWKSNETKKFRYRWSEIEWVKNWLARNQTKPNRPKQTNRLELKMTNKLKYWLYLEKLFRFFVCCFRGYPKWKHHSITPIHHPYGQSFHFLSVQMLKFYISPKKRKEKENIKSKRRCAKRKIHFMFSVVVWKYGILDLKKKYWFFPHSLFTFFFFWSENFKSDQTMKKKRTHWISLRTFPLSVVRAKKQKTKNFDVNIKNMQEKNKNPGKKSSKKNSIFKIEFFFHFLWNTHQERRIQSIQAAEKKMLLENFPEAFPKTKLNWKFSGSSINKHYR